MNKVKVSRITRQAIEDNTKSRIILSVDPLWTIDLTKEPWSPFETENNYLTSKKFKSVQVLAYDFDNVPGKDKYLSLKDAVSKFETYECIIGTTRSHQKIKDTCPVPVDRFRVILVLQEPITNLIQYQQNYIFYADLLGISESIDLQCKDGARFFYPFTEVVFSNIKGTRLPVQELTEIVTIAKAAPPPTNHRGDFGHKTRLFIEGRTNKSSRHMAAKDAATELRKLNYSADEITSLLEPAFISMKPGAERELQNLVDWVIDNVEPVAPEISIKKSLNKSTTYLLTKKKNRGFGVDEYQKAILDMKKCGYKYSEMLEILTPIFAETNPDQPPGTLEALVEHLSSALGNEKTTQSLLLNLETHFADKICVFRDSAGSERIFEYAGPNTIRQIGSRSFLVDFADKLAELGHENMLSNNIKELCETFLIKTKNKIKTLPPSFSLDDNELSFNHITLDIKEGPTPTWDDFISRCGDNGPALMAYVWSIFERDIKIPQYLMLVGHGEDGKGSFTNWLANILGAGAYASLDVADPHWVSQCIGKRVGFFEELNNPKIVMSSQFKAITGGDAVTVTQKYEKSITATLDIRFILATNQLPEFTSKAAEKRRLILVNVSSPTHFITDYKLKIKEESAGFLFKCREAFNKLYNAQFLKIDCHYSDFEELAGSYEEQYSWLFDKCFMPKPGKFIRDGVTSSDFVDIVKIHLRSPDKYFMNGFKEWMRRTKDVQFKTSSGKGYYTNIALKDDKILRLL